MMAGPIEQKAGAATLATFAATQIVWAIFTFWPAANQAVSTDNQLQLTALLATILTAAAGYYAKHTHRPDLEPPRPGMVATTTWAPGAAPPPPARKVARPRHPEQPPPDAGDS